MDYQLPQLGNYLTNQSLNLLNLYWNENTWHSSYSDEFETHLYTDEEK